MKVFFSYSLYLRKKKKEERREEKKERRNRHLIVLLCHPTRHPTRQCRRCHPTRQCRLLLILNTTRQATQSGHAWEYVASFVVTMCRVKKNRSIATGGKK